MKKIAFISFMLIGLIYDVKSCDCVIYELNDQTRKEAFEYADLVFLGEVISKGQDGTFKFRIIESFKGDSGIKEIKGELFSSCSFAPNEGEGQWIVYGNIVNGKIELSQCGLTRSYRNPHMIMSSTYPPPSPRLNESEYNKYIDQIREIAQVDWKGELKILRKR